MPTALGGSIKSNGVFLPLWWGLASWTLAAPPLPIQTPSAGACSDVQCLHNSLPPPERVNIVVAHLAYTFFCYFIKFVERKGGKRGNRNLSVFRIHPIRRSARDANALRCFFVAPAAPFQAAELRLRGAAYNLRARPSEGFSSPRQCHA